MIRLRMGKFCGGESAHGKLGNQLRRRRGFAQPDESFPWIDDVCAGAKYGDGFPFRGKRAAMRGSIDPTRESTENDEATHGEIVGQPLGHADTIRSWMTGADHRNAGLREY